MDTLGHTVGGTVGLYECHGGGGNQVSLMIVILIVILLINIAQFSAVIAIFEAFSLLKVMVCLLLNVTATYCNKHTLFVIIMNSVYGPFNVCLIHMV